MGKQSLSIFNFSIFILKLFASVIVLGLCINYCFEKYVVFDSEISGAGKINRILKQNYTEEIPIFGSSRAEGSFVPSIISENCFNYGISGGQANIWLFFLEEELKKEKETPIIVNFDLAGLAYSDGDIGNYIPNWKSTRHILSQEGESYYYIPFVKYFGRFELYFKYFLNERLNLTKVTDNGGSFERNALTKEKFEMLINKRRISSSEFILDHKLLIIFEKLLNATKRKIILVISPYHTSYFERFRNIGTVDKYLMDLNERENVNVIDLRDYVKDNEMYLNTTHLNYQGAVYFTEKLYNELQLIIN